MDDVFHRTVGIGLASYLVKELTFIRYYSGLDVGATKIDSHIICHISKIPPFSLYS